MPALCSASIHSRVVVPEDTATSMTFKGRRGASWLTRSFRSSKRCERVILYVPFFNLREEKNRVSSSSVATDSEDSRIVRALGTFSNGAGSSTLRAGPRSLQIAPHPDPLYPDPLCCETARITSPNWCSQL